MSTNPNQRVRKGEELPEEPLKKYLKTQGLITSEHTTMSVEQFTHGYSNLTYLLFVEGKEFVLRKPPVGAIKRGHDMSREFRVQRGLKAVFDKVPTMYAYSNDETILGSEFYLMEKVEGIILNYQEAKKRDLSPKDFGAVSATWLDTMVQLHALDYKACGLEDLGKPNGYVARQVTNWGKQYLKAATDEVAAAHQIMQWLEAHQPKSYDSCLIHNDYKYDNVVFEDASWTEIKAILDWEMATLGDPLMDLGTSLGYWTVATDPAFLQQGIPSPTLFEGNPKRSEIVQHYAEKSGRDVNNILFYYAFGLFKIAVIAQQIFYRYNKGLTTDPRFAQLDKAAAMCCAWAMKCVQTKSID